MWSKDSGLGIVEKMIDGNLLSGAGLFYLLLQLYTTMKIGAAFSIPMVSLVPLLTLITNRGGEEGTFLTWATLAFVSVMYAILRACECRSNFAAYGICISCLDYYFMHGTWIFRPNLDADRSSCTGRWSIIISLVLQHY